MCTYIHFTAKGLSWFVTLFLSHRHTHTSTTNVRHCNPLVSFFFPTLSSRYVHREREQQTPFSLLASPPPYCYFTVVVEAFKTPGYYRRPFIGRRAAADCRFKGVFPLSVVKKKRDFHSLRRKKVGKSHASLGRALNWTTEESLELYYPMIRWVAFLDWLSLISNLMPIIFMPMVSFYAPKSISFNWVWQSFQLAAHGVHISLSDNALRCICVAQSFYFKIINSSFKFRLIKELLSFERGKSLNAKANYV